jgi:malate dehydrogenase (oxaloacetate-decarboxylating)
MTGAVSERVQGINETDKEAKKDDNFGVLELIYTLGVAVVAEAISSNKELVYDYTSKWNNVAIVSDGTRVLGLGNIGPQGALPVMERKSMLFKLLGDINAYPLCLNTTDKDEIIDFVKAAEPIFGAINIEDIESPKVLEIVERLQRELPIPIFYDDQHGTSIIALAALLNALKVVNKPNILKQVGCNQILVIDSKE